MFLQVASYNSNEKPDQLAVLGWLVPPRLEPATPSTEKQADGFSPLLLSVLRLWSCQWNWVVADATEAPRLVPDGTSQARNPMKIHKI